MHTFVFDLDIDKCRSDHKVMATLVNPKRENLLSIIDLLQGLFGIRAKPEVEVTKHSIRLLPLALQPSMEDP